LFASCYGNVGNDTKDDEYPNSPLDEFNSLLMQFAQVAPLSQPCNRIGIHASQFVRARLEATGDDACNDAVSEAFENVA
jgi:hypothetical protein